MFRFVIFLCFLSTISLFGHDVPSFDMTLMIPMRDGTQLATDIYLPKGDKQEDLPCVLIRDPAGRGAEHSKRFLSLVNRGYIVAIQDTRSAMDTEGKTLPYISDGWGEQQDGYDAVEWLAKSPLTNGKIGTLGCSATGITQHLLAPTAPPSLKCQYIGIAASSLYHHAMYPGGQLRKEKVEGWLGLYARDPSVKTFVTDQPQLNEFWESFDSRMVANQIEAPGFHYGGWYDTFSQGTIDGFVSRQMEGGKGARGTQKLVLGPWSHFFPLSTHFGDFPLPQIALQPPIDMTPATWFDYHLKGMANSIESLPSVTYYVMGPFDGSESSGNCWRHAEIWPPECQEFSLFLSADGTLSESKPISTSYSYQVDPKNPVPTIGGSNLFLESGPKCQQAIEERDDVLVFTSELLQEDIEVTGRLAAKIFFSSDCYDTDVAIRLTDVYPDGRSVLISDGIYRTGGLGKERDSQKPHEISLDMWSTSMVFAKGHRVRISIAGSNYPRYECNTHGGYGSDACVEAKHHIHTGESTPSRLILPLVRRGEKWLVE